MILILVPRLCYFLVAICKNNVTIVTGHRKRDTNNSVNYPKMPFNLTMWYVMEFYNTVFIRIDALGAKT